MPEPLTLTLAASAARTTSGEGAALDGEKPGRSGKLDLVVSAVSGTTPTLAVGIETSETGADGSWATADGFPAVSGATRLCLSVGHLQRYVRGVWVLGGTTPNFTFELKAKLYSFLISRLQLEARLGSTTVARALADSGSQGADEDRVNRILADVTSMLRGKIGPVDTLDGLPPDVVSELVRIGLDVAHGKIALVAPEVLRCDGEKMLSIARKELREIRIGQADIGVPEHKPAAPLGARVRSSQSARGWDDC